jgi:hypothetical protein
MTNQRKKKAGPQRGSVPAKQVELKEVEVCGICEGHPIATLLLPLDKQPSWAGGDRKAPSARELRSHGAEIKALLEKAADTLEKLTPHGWKFEVGRDGLVGFPPVGLESTAEVKQKLARLGLDPEEFGVEHRELV